MLSLQCPLLPLTGKEVLGWRGGGKQGDVEEVSSRGQGRKHMWALEESPGHLL